MKRLFMLACLACTPCWAEDDLPSFGAEATRMSRQEENRLGREIYMEVRRNIPFWDDYLVIDYIDSIGASLSTGADRGFSFRFFVINEMTMNAFALPGGWIGIYTGIISLCDTESEIAAIMAHEMAHITQRHNAQIFEHASSVQGWSIAGLLASALLSAYNAEAGEGALAATVAAGQQSMIHFTRENERDADRVGLQIMANAGFDPKGMADIFTRMGEQQKYYGSDIPPFLLTHPLSENRTRDALMRAKEIPYKAKEQSDHFGIIKARIKALGPKTVYAALRGFVAGSQNPSEQYGLALAHIRANEPAKAQVLLNKLPEAWQRKPAFSLAQSDIYLAEHQETKAINLLENTAKIHPYNRAVIFSMVSLHVSQKKYSAAMLALQRLGERYPNDSSRLYWLARCAANLQDPYQATLYEIDYHMSQFDYDEAKERIRYALKRFKDKKQTAELERRDQALKELQPRK